jgi:hypothetical protein
LLTPSKGLCETQCHSLRAMVNTWLSTERYRFTVAGERVNRFAFPVAAERFEPGVVVGSASDQLVDTLPNLLDHEREALVAQLTQTINSQSATLGTLAGHLRSTLQAGTDTATAVNSALQSFERISSLFAKKPPSASAPPQPPGKPFDISDYTAMLEQAALTARELDALAQRGDALTPLLRSATQDAALRAQGVLNHLFLLLVLVIASAALLAALAYRRITMRFAGG